MGKHGNRETMFEIMVIYMQISSKQGQQPWGNLFSQKYKYVVNLLISCKFSHIELLCNSVSHSNVQASYYDHAVKWVKVNKSHHLYQICRT